MASIAERLSLACAKTVVSEDKPLFLGELSMSYLSAAPNLVSKTKHLSFEFDDFWIFEIRERL